MSITLDVPEKEKPSRVERSPDLDRVMKEFEEWEREQEGENKPAEERPDE